MRMYLLVLSKQKHWAHKTGAALKPKLLHVVGDQSLKALQKINTDFVFYTQIA